MSYSLENSDDLTAVANAIRGQGYGFENMTVTDMAETITNIDISGGGIYGTLAYTLYSESNSTSSAKIPSNGGTYDVSLPIDSTDTPFAFIFTTYAKSASPPSITTPHPDTVYILFWDGGTLYSLPTLNNPPSSGDGIIPVSYFNISFAVTTDEGDNPVLRITNNTTGSTSEVYQISLYHCGVVKQGTSYWGICIYPS